MERSQEIVVTKSSASVRVGITFESDEEARQGRRRPRPRVKALHPYGLAATNGLQIGDEIVAINGEAVSSPLTAAAMLREEAGDITLSVRRAHTSHSERSGPRPVPPLQLAAAAEERDLGSGLDIGELTQRALRGLGDLFSSLGDDLSRLLRPEHHAAATLISAVWRGHHCRVLLAQWRWAALELERLRGGRAMRQAATEEHLRAVRQHRAAATIQSAARGAIDRQWVLMLRAQITLRNERRAAEVAGMAAGVRDVRSRGHAGRVERARRAFSFKRKQKPGSRPEPSAGGGAGG
eukprot:CAMPEP_0119062278 /NCGR_PEP_ID=MMETSP1178-20130426/5900_1 /TAXON_ID=33656 /ORGANISM="unid sp, Strain CCMP2000" /LENGTH=293 /DNA_ID=CAMNT_0007043547 /DNA_START=44 /DNA_END=921 /DNA_ORIENTATION=+